ncbi:MAG: hypothetical protein QGG38_06200, partial [Nitrospinaceae bacterium]|nr:hypothetical protein [Nitrospinaceae bacterium]
MTMYRQFNTAEDIFAGRLRGNQLMASGIALTPDVIRLLWTSETMKEITWLDLDDNQLGDEGVRELADCELLANVQYLNLNKNGVTDEGLIHLARSKYLTKLKRLHIKDNAIQGPGI